MTSGKVLRPNEFAERAPRYKELDDSGGEPPHNDNMEARISALEQFAKDAKDRLTRVETKLDHIDKEVGQVKWWIIAQILAGILAALGTGVAIQQMTVATFQGAAQVAKDSAPSSVQPQQPIIINVPGPAINPAQEK